MFTSKRLILSAAAVVVAAALVLGVNLLVCKPNRLVIRNSSGMPLESIRLAVGQKNGGRIAEWKVKHLEQGGEFVIRHHMNDFSIDMTFTASGREYHHSEPYVDLWKGEGWVIDVQPDGSAKSGH